MPVHNRALQNTISHTNSHLGAIFNRWKEIWRNPTWIWGGYAQLQDYNWTQYLDCDLISIFPDTFLCLLKTSKNKHTYEGHIYYNLHISCYNAFKRNYTHYNHSWKVITVCSIVYYLLQKNITPYALRIWCLVTWTLLLMHHVKY